MEALEAIGNILMALSKILDEWAEFKREQIVKEAENAKSEDEMLTAARDISQQLRQPH